MSASTRNASRNSPTNSSRVPARVVMTAVAVCGAVLLLAACSGSGADSSETPASDSPASGSPATDSPAMEAGNDPAMLALCEQMVADAMTPEDATALAEQNGYVARVGSVDGEPRAVTMDYRLDRFTFDVVDGVVVACQYG